ncbi:lipoprotein [Sodalis sp. dw_96]|uniref:lipoprotein n=1 Tax=Sodalis sp. dw_96 TaxID=2719794 RepID=UPI001BD38096|nr:lipoprotein [Sodalis sp. dw_96]
MKKKAFAALAVILSLALTGCNKLTEYRLSEQDVNGYLQKHNNFQKAIGVPGLLNANIVLTDLTSQIGRTEPDKVRLSGNARLDIQSLWGAQQADLKLTLQAQPYYDKEQGAIYLKDMQLVDYQVQPEKLQPTFKVLTPYLENSLKSYFDNKPAYVLDPSRNKTEALAKKLAKGLEVKPGELIIPFIGS